MLQSLSIKNIALIKSQTIEFEKGLNVLTGETGAGKSLVVDALSLLLGEKADKTLISYGETVASVEAVFSLNAEQKKLYLEQFGIDDDMVIITRKLSTDGRNEVRVNGDMVTLSNLKKISAPLMDLHGQFEHQNLLKVANHIKIIDKFSKEVDKPLKDYMAELKKYNSLVDELNSYDSDDAKRNRQLDLYKYQIDEIDAAKFYDGEEEELKEFRNQVLHQEKIIESVKGATNLILGDGYEYQGLQEIIKKSILELTSASKYNEKLNPLIDRLENSKIELEDIGETLEDDFLKFTIDEGKAKENEERLDLLSSLKKKYGSSISEINKYREEIGKEYDRIINAQDRIAELHHEIADSKEQLLNLALKLSAVRKSVAKKFEQCIENELKQLEMKSAKFVVDFKQLDIENRIDLGLDRVEFMLRTNLGEELKPLKDVVSGGEMSRFMLAVKNVTASIEGISTLIFDEIDSGVSGKVALTIAEKLKKVSHDAQVICITHLPQIASFGDHHLVIEKKEENNKTRTYVYSVDGQAREEEIARLISGNITSHSLEHAKEMLLKGKEY